MQAKEAYNRRYVGGRESMSYVLYDSAKSFHIDEYVTRFVTDVVKIDLKWNSRLALINGVWDVVNDSIFGGVVDKTFTRWGKFRPYLFASATLGTLFNCLFWMTPLFFDKNPLNTGKLIYWLLLAMVRESFGTFKDISENGLMSSITPNPTDRVRMYAMAEVISSIWESLPAIIMGVLIDLANRNIGNFSMQSAYVTMGTVTMVACGILGVFFALYSRERISQTPEKHSYLEGLKTIIRNPPLLLIMLSDFLGGFSVETWEHNYYIDVLGSESLRNIVRLPGGPVSFLSYTYINKLRANIPIKWLWIFGANLKNIVNVFIMIIGSFGKTYQKTGPMVVLLMLQNFVYMSFLSVNKIIPREITFDALDYAEWKNGFRSEGVILATKGMIAKLVRNVINSMTTYVMALTDYSLEAGFGQQSERAKYALFFMSFGTPVIFGFLSLIPKLFYNLSGDRRRQMYEELSEMRKERNIGYDNIKDSGSQ